MKQINLIWLSLILLFLIETTIMHWLIPSSWQEHASISPRFVFTVIIFIALYARRYFALILGLVFGLLHDVIFYGHMIGPYSFSMGLTGYLTGLIFGRTHIRLVFTLLIMVIANLFFEFIIYGLYRIFRVVDESFGWAILHHILPSLLFNLLFALIIYIPIRYWLEKMESQREHEEN